MSIVTKSAAVRSNHHADDEQRVCREVSDPKFNCEGYQYGLDAGCDVELRATNGGLRWLKYHRLMRQNYVMPPIPGIAHLSSLRFPHFSPHH